MQLRLGEYVIHVHIAAATLEAPSPEPPFPLDAPAPPKPSQPARSGFNDEWELDDFDELLKRDFKTGDAVGTLAERALPVRFLKGHVAFRVPRRMWKDLAELVELRLVPRDVLEPYEVSQLEASFRSRGGAITHDLLARLGSRMEAELLAEAAMFRVEALSSAAQDLDMDSATPVRWDWRVTPLRTGRSTVRLRLTIRRDALGASYDFDTAPFERVVEVRVQSASAEVRRFWRDNWKWVLTAGGGLGAGATLWGWVSGLVGGG
jgi:hypothetical protein